LVACKVLELVGNEVLHQEERRDESKSESQEGGRARERGSEWREKFEFS
jgi:hypothetical protein